MLFVRACSTILLTAALIATPAFAGRSHRAATSGHSKKKAVKHQVIGQRGIDSERATEIQQALIREKYLSGQPSGQWDEETEAAMQKYQADHGWQTKLVPDSRALIKLGLGPDHSGALDASSTAPANTSPAPAPSAPVTPSVAAANTLASAHTIRD
ncbi:MAG TPA: peptidoglycan-binding domain-containing protein [Pseudacidobacterium sp.]|nr:peptidoglycan-binding domain-containing protein [Pseudacidobacterium sp.]